MILILQVIQQAFGIGKTVGQATNNSQAVASFLGQFIDRSDLAAFQQRFNLAADVCVRIFFCSSE